MGIERDLHDLLFCHDCVIVPQWGGFLTHYRPARLDEARKLVHPPGKDVSFNKHLVRNDGLLADRLAKREGIAFDTASARIDSEVAGWRDALARNGRLEVPSIGTFYHDTEHNLQFEPSDRVNFLKDAYGLRPVIAIPVQRSRPAPVVRPIMEPEPVMEHVERRVPMLWAAAAVTAVLFGAAAFWAYRMGGSETAQWSGIASWITKPERTYVPPTEASLLPVSTPAPFVLPEEELGVRTIPLTPDDSVHVIVDLGLAVPNAAPRDSTAVAPRAVTTAGVRARYHVVAGCFAQPENAEKLLAELLGKGYPALRLPIRGQLHPVVFGSYVQRSDALHAMEGIRHDAGGAAWLLVR